jgi:hypothetical protein
MSRKKLFYFFATFFFAFAFASLLEEQQPQHPVIVSPRS